MLIVAVWFACFSFEPAFLKKDLDDALRDMLSNMRKFCYCPPAAVFDSDWTSLSPDFRSALQQCTSGYTDDMFTITPHAFFQASQPNLTPEPRVGKYFSSRSKYLILTVIAFVDTVDDGGLYC